MFVVGVYLVSGLEQGGPSFLKIHQALLFLFFQFNLLESSVSFRL